MTKPYYSQNPLDRRDDLRPALETNFEAVNFRASDRFLVRTDEGIVTAPAKEQALFSHGELPKIGAAEAYFLGQRGESRYFVISAGQINQSGFHAVPGRAFALENWLPGDEMGIAAEAEALVNWHKQSPFCSACGGPTRAAQAGWQRNCPACKKMHFPRTDTVVIMMVTRGEFCLLGRGHQFVEGRFSCLAGFVEPGETLEDAARRELKEEASIDGGDVRYLCSQPWPFPHNLMIGVSVEALSETIIIDPKEIAEARWFSREEIKQAMQFPERQDFSLPPSIAIARDLLEIWLASPPRREIP